MTLTLDIAMLGPSGAGKTSLLVSMFAQFSQVTTSTGLVLAPQDGATSAELDKYRLDLERIGRELVVRESGIAGTRFFRQHIFSLKDQGAAGKAHIDIRFSDYPGGWLTSTEPTPLELEDRLNQTDILMVAIDTPALMAERGRWHHHFNHPQRIGDELTKWAGTPRQLLLLVPLKCEKWVNDASSIEKLEDTIKSEYSEILAGVWAAPNRPRVVISPVQTVGSLVFDRFEIHAGVPQVKFQGRSPGLRYSPQWTAEPLRLVVQTALSRQQTSRSGFETFMDFVTGDGHHLRVALDKLANQRLGQSLDWDGR